MALSVLAHHLETAWAVMVAYRRLQDSESQLVESAKLAAVGQLAAGVAHELNNPMGSIQLALDLCRRQGMAQRGCPGRRGKSRARRAVRSLQ
jgi:C4-dicarboxylate-specific signal transduction histidine kinase